MIKQTRTPTSPPFPKALCTKLNTRKPHTYKCMYNILPNLAAIAKNSIHTLSVCVENEHSGDVTSGIMSANEQ